MRNDDTISRIKLSLRNGAKNDRLYELQMNSLKMMMALVKNGGMMQLKGDDKWEEDRCFILKGVSFDHEMNTLEIIVQQKEDVI